MDTHVYKTSADFSSSVALPVTFGRAAGMALGSDGSLYVVDQTQNQIDVLDSQYSITRTIPTGRTPIGLAIGPDGALYYTDNPYSSVIYLSRMMRVDLERGDAQSVIQSNLPFLAG